MSRRQVKKIGHFLGLFLVFAVAILTDGERKSVSAGSLQRRIRYQITTVRESRATEREILAQTTIEGLPGTDFKIALDTGNFKMETRFINELTADQHLKVRAHLSTRRFYGYSPQSLPLYEEDNQTKTFESDFNETIVLYPFGNDAPGGNSNAAPNGEVLKIEIIPALLMTPSKDRTSELTINFDKPLPGGEISIVAEKIPHRFNVEARIETGGRVVARGVNVFSLEEDNEISLLPTSNADAGAILPSLKVKMSVDRIIRSRPQDLAGIKFDFYRMSENGADLPAKIISGGAGMGALGGEISYPLGKLNGADDENYQLKFKIINAEKEDESSGGVQ